MAKDKMNIPSGVEAKAAGVPDAETVARRARLAHAGLPNAEEVASGKKASRKARWEASFREDPAGSIATGIVATTLIALLGYGMYDALSTNNRPAIIPAPSPITLSITPEEAVVGLGTTSVLLFGLGCVLLVGENRRK